MFNFMFKKKFLFIIFFFVSILLILNPTANCANRPFNPFLSGNPIGEPMVSLGSVAIEKEILTVDLRELANFQRNQAIEFLADTSTRLITVETTYKLVNSGSAQNVTFTFFGDESTFKAGTNTGLWLDDQAVAIEFFDSEEKQLPLSWGIPINTPAVEKDWKIPYRPSVKSSSIRFKLEVPSGKHNVKVRYMAQPSTYLLGDQTIPWQFVYMLTPARDWVGFTGLDATIYIPKGWEFNSNLTLNSDGEKITGSWLSLPANALTLTVRTPVPNVFSVSIFAWLLGPGLCLFAGTMIGKLMRRYNKSLALAIPLSILIGVGWSSLIFLSMTYDQNHLKTLVGEHQLCRPNGSFIKIASFPIIMAVGIVLAQVSAFFSHRNVVESKR